MESKVRRTEIQIETHEVKVIRLPSRPSLALCERCSDIVTALTPEQTADVLGLTREDVFRLVESERVHLVSPERAIICGNSFGDEKKFVPEKRYQPVCK
jgi:hypothetical protein